MPYKILAFEQGSNQRGNAPFEIPDPKRNWFVEDAKTHKKFSKKPMTKLQAERQRVAIALSEHRQHPKTPVVSYFA